MRGDSMRMGRLVTLVLVIAATILPIAVEQAQGQKAQGEQTENCLLEKDWKPENLPHILAEHQEWLERWRGNGFSKQWTEDHPEGRAVRQAKLARSSW